MQKLSSVLLVDDDGINNFLNERLLHNLGVTDHLLVAETGTEALNLLQKAEATPPALILLDVNMPGMTGLEFMEKYQPFRQSQTQSTVVLMLTTTMDSSELARINELQIDGLVSKPLTEEKIANILQLHFQRTISA